MSERLIEFEIQRDDEAIEKIYQKVLKGRDFLSELEAGMYGELATASSNGATIDPSKIVLTKIK